MKDQGIVARVNAANRYISIIGYDIRFSETLREAPREIALLDGAVEEYYASHGRTEKIVYKILSKRINSLQKRKDILTNYIDKLEGIKLIK